MTITQSLLFDFPPEVDVYHNTTDLSGEHLKTARSKADAQNSLILEFFRDHPNIDISPSEVMRMLNLPGVPITSYRRSLTDLTKLPDPGYSYLVKNGKDKQIPGPMGRPENTWRLRK